MANLIKLNTNENPYPPSPLALAALNGELGAQLRLYPDPDSRSLRDCLAKLHGLERENVFVGNGSDEVLALCFLAFFQGRASLEFPDISYTFYPVYARLFGIEPTRIPVGEDFGIDLRAYAARPTPPGERPGAVLFPNPNAPTGIALGRDRIEELLLRAPDRLVVVDEAYVDFGAESAIPLIPSHENLLVVQTLSKSRSLAGLRVGFALGQAELITGLERVKNSFNSYPIDRVAERVAVAALGDDAYFRRCRDSIVLTRESTREQLLELGFEVLPSRANFLFVHHPGIPAARLCAELRERSILVRHFDRPRIDAYLRITIGTQDEMRQLVAALRGLIGEP
jgi:histidinol-phosphate aminotransferase